MEIQIKSREEKVRKSEKEKHEKETNKQRQEYETQIAKLQEAVSNLKKVIYVLVFMTSNHLLPSSYRKKEEDQTSPKFSKTDFQSMTYSPSSQQFKAILKIFFGEYEPTEDVFVKNWIFL